MEHYRDQEALDEHFGSEHLGAFLSQVTPLLKKQPEIEIEEQADEAQTGQLIKKNIFEFALRCVNDLIKMSV